MEPILDIEWDEIVPGMWIRWVTRSFVRRGKIVRKKGRSIAAVFDGSSTPTIIPDARMYFDMVSKHDMIVVIDVSDSQSTLEAIPSDAQWVDASRAALVLGIDAKAVRRQIRAGKLKAKKQNGTWLIELSQLKGAE